MSKVSSMFDMTGQVAMITGGASGIGKAIAGAYIQQGAKVLVGDVRAKEEIDQSVQELCQLVETPDGQDAASGVILDVTSDDSAEAAVNEAVNVFGRLDVVVNCAGIMCKKPTLELSTKDFNNLFNIHVTGALRCNQAAGHLMREQHSGCIINIASISSFVDLVEVAAYAAAKSAMMGLTRSLANEWAKYGIRTNGIAPGFIPTELNRKLIENTDRGRRILEHTPMARFGTGDEITGAAVYLASPAASFVNGHTIVVDGGFMACGVGDSFAPWAQPGE